MRRLLRWPWSVCEVGATDWWGNLAVLQSRYRKRKKRKESHPREGDWKHEKNKWIESDVIGCEAEEGNGRRKETKLALELCLLILSNQSGSNTIMRRLKTGIRSEKCVVRLFRCCANVIDCTYTNLDSIAYYTPRLYGIAFSCKVTNLYSMLLYRIL